MMRLGRTVSGETPNLECEPALSGLPSFDKTSVAQRGWYPDDGLKCWRASILIEFTTHAEPSRLGHLDHQKVLQGSTRPQWHRKVGIWMID